MVLLILLFCSFQPLFAEEEGSLDWYHEQASQAIAAERYETAVRIIEEGKERYPQAPGLNVLLADLYYDKELYNLALEEYQNAEQKGGEDFQTLNQIARCYGKLNQEQDSIRYLTKILDLYPDSITTFDDLGWMYFKTHQLEKGEELLLEALDRFGPDPGLYMTLGTLYSGLYDYNNSKRFYLKAIQEALKVEDDYFVSVAYYNLSLLEHSFYNYNSSLRCTEESIERADRAPGHLSKGELYQSRLDFKLALAEYQKALQKDTTSLTEVNMAILYQKFGLLEPARRYAEEVLKSKDLAWMYYYGTDIERHYKDIHEILADIYLGLARTELMKPTHRLFQRLHAFSRALAFRLRAYYHRQKFRLYSIRVGRAYLEEKNLLDAYWEFYKGSEAYEKVALDYLSRARRIESEVSPHSEAFYLQEEGKIRGSLRLLEESLQSLDSFWEREAIAEGLALLIPLLEDRVSRRRAINRLYEINPGALQQRGLGLPLEIEIVSPASGRGTSRHLRRLLERAGTEIARREGLDGFSYRLRIELEESGRASFRLIRLETGEASHRGALRLEASRSKERAARLTKLIIDKIYSIN